MWKLTAAAHVPPASRPLPAAISIPEGIELPGPQTQRLVHFTAQFVFQTSPRLEPEILRQQRAAGSHKVGPRRDIGYLPMSGLLKILHYRVPKKIS